MEIPADEALARLRAGNERFASSRGRPRPAFEEGLRAGLADGQSPFAIVLGCSDSRVPAEFVFDQGLGDLFVIRVAGNVAAPSQIGSVELAATLFGTRLAVVLGHSRCGAVEATLAELRAPGAALSDGLRAIVDRVRPAVEEQLALGVSIEPEEVVRRAIRSNVRSSARALRTGSPALATLIRDQGLVVVGAEYSLETGLVDFFDGVER